MRVDNYGFLYPKLTVVRSSDIYGLLHPEQRAKMLRISECFYWIAALDAFDYCDPEPLRTLLEGNEPIPEEIRPAIAKIVTGERRPNKRAAAKLKVPAAARMKLAATLSHHLGWLDVFKYDVILDQGCLRRAIEYGADKMGTEPIDELRRLHAETAQVMVSAAKVLEPDSKVPP